MYDLVKHILASPDVSDLQKEILKYHPESYRPSTIHPPLSLSAFSVANDPAAVLAQSEIRWESKGELLMVVLEWPLTNEDEIPLAIEAPEPLAVLEDKARAERRVGLDCREFWFSNEVTKFCWDCDVLLTGSRWGGSRPIIVAITKDRTSSLVIKYTSAREVGILNRVRSLMNESSTQQQQYHLISLFADPIPASGTSRFVVAMFDHGKDLLQYYPPEVPRASSPITLSARVYDEGPKLWDDAPTLWADLPILWAEQLCCAVCFLHRHRIIHRDIKADNITIDKKTHQLTLVDFSAAEYLSPGTSFIIGGDLPGTPGPIVGTSGCVHPAVQQWLDTQSGEVYDGRKADMWAVGQVLGVHVAGLGYVDDASKTALREFGSWLKEKQTSDLEDVLGELRRSSLKVVSDRRCGSS